ncbi:hypothetical protein chiPu_0027851, partial [Chiloscyllium punctatum]|nr:hypothetical protein [Chiloscyllium punctatum]
MPVIVEKGYQHGDERLDALLTTLWSQHDTDVGTLKSVSPVVIRFKPGAGAFVKFLTNGVIL